MGPAGEGGSQRQNQEQWMELQRPDPGSGRRACVINLGTGGVRDLRLWGRGRRRGALHPTAPRGLLRGRMAASVMCPHCQPLHGNQKRDGQTQMGAPANERLCKRHHRGTWRLGWGRESRVGARRGGRKFSFRKEAHHRAPAPALRSMRPVKAREVPTLQV